MWFDNGQGGIFTLVFNVCSTMYSVYKHTKLKCYFSMVCTSQVLCVYYIHVFCVFNLLDDFPWWIILIILLLIFILLLLLLVCCWCWRRRYVVYEAEKLGMYTYVSCCNYHKINFFHTHIALLGDEIACTV